MLIPTLSNIWHGQSESRMLAQQAGDECRSKWARKYRHRKGKAALRLQRSKDSGRWKARRPGSAARRVVSRGQGEVQGRCAGKGACRTRAAGIGRRRTSDGRSAAARGPNSDCGGLGTGPAARMNFNKRTARRYYPRDRGSARGARHT